MRTQHNFGEMVYSYARFSTKQQSLGDSERRQQENAQYWANEHGCKVTYILDPGISARRGKNRTVGQSGAFIARLRSGELGNSPTLLVENFDRISREDITDALPGDHRRTRHDGSRDFRSGACCRRNCVPRWRRRADCRRRLGR